MRDSQLARLLRDMRRSLTVVEQRHRPARRNLAAWAGLGYPTTSIGGSRGGSGGHSDPTLNAAATAINRADRDRFVTAYRDLEQAIADAATKLAEAERIAVAATVTTNAPAAPGCHECCRVKLPRGHACDAACRARDHTHTNGWQEIHQRLPDPAFEPDADDPEKQPQRLPYCSWHVDFIGRYGIVPAPEITLWHLDHPGSKVPGALIRDHHPTEYQAHNDRRRQTRAS